MRETARWDVEFFLYFKILILSIDSNSEYFGAKISLEPEFEPGCWKTVILKSEGIVASGNKNPIVVTVKVKWQENIIG